MGFFQRLFGSEDGAKAAVGRQAGAAAMQTLPAERVSEPFGKIVYWPQPDGARRIRAYILIERTFEGAQTGIALDGSGSMAPAYGAEGQHSANIVSPLAQKMCAYLARQLDADGGTTAIYWATGEQGDQIEVIGDLTAEQAERFLFAGPRRYGRSTKLKPAVEYFVERFAEAEWGMFIFVTDGEIHDLEAVADYSTRLARDIQAGRRKQLKLVLIGVGEAIKESQMEMLDNLETGTEVDLWDHKIATQMSHLAEIFAEVVDESTTVAAAGLIRGGSGAVIKDYRDTGVPALLEFVLPAGETAFQLEIDGQIVTQSLA